MDDALRHTLDVHDLQVVRGGHLVASAIGFKLQPPCWMGIIGANGSGKTSLLRALAGRLPLTSGRILTDGVAQEHDRAWRARWFGFAPDAAALPPELSGRELLTLLSRAPRSPSATLRSARIAEALALEPLLDWPIGALSAGIRQRVAIACAFAGEPCCVILDEPFNWLDPLVAFELRRTLRSIADEGLLLVTALHDLQTWATSCDRGLLMADGRVIYTADAETLRAGAADLVLFEAKIMERLQRSNAQ